MNVLVHFLCCILLFFFCFEFDKAFRCYNTKWWKMWNKVFHFIHYLLMNRLSMEFVTENFYLNESKRMRTEKRTSEKEKSRVEFRKRGDKFTIVCHSRFENNKVLSLAASFVWTWSAFAFFATASTCCGNISNDSVHEYAHICPFSKTLKMNQKKRNEKLRWQESFISACIMKWVRINYVFCVHFSSFSSVVHVRHRRFWLRNGSEIAKENRRRKKRQKPISNSHTVPSFSVSHFWCLSAMKATQMSAHCRHQHR